MRSEQVSDVAVQFAPAAPDPFPIKNGFSVVTLTPCALTKVKSAAVRLEASIFALKVSVTPTSCWFTSF